MLESDHAFESERELIPRARSSVFLPVSEMADEEWDPTELTESAKGTKWVRWLEASEKGMLDVVQEILSDKADKEELLNFQEEGTGHSALHKAAKRGQLEMAKLLLAEGADPNIDDAELKTCLHVRPVLG